MTTASATIPQTGMRKGWTRLWRHHAAAISLILILLIYVAALGANIFAPYDPNYQHPQSLTLSPSFRFPFGTDSLGRDLFSRVLFGSRVSMLVALATAVSGLLVGFVYGGIAGMLGGWVDTLLMRVLELLYTFPTLLLLILLNVVMGEGLMGVVVALSMESAITVARLVRGQVLQLKQSDFVMAARAVGASRRNILWKHLFPNMLGPIIVTLTFLIPTNIMYEAFLSFIGLGVQPPYSSWGTLANEGWRGLQSYPHLILFPGMAIFITMLAFNFFGDGLRDALDPKGAGK